MTSLYGRQCCSKHEDSRCGRDQYRFKNPITTPHIHIRTSSLQARLVSRHGTLHTRDMPSKYNTANADIPDINIHTWLELNRLPYNHFIVTKLHMIGKDLCVEDLKLFKTHHIEALFGDEYYIVMLRAELAWEDLGGRDKYSFKNPNPNLNHSTKTNSDPASSGSTASRSTNKKKTNVMHKNRMPSVFKFGFSTKVTKKKA